MLNILLIILLILTMVILVAFILSSTLDGTETFKAIDEKIANWIRGGDDRRGERQ